MKNICLYKSSKINTKACLKFAIETIHHRKVFLVCPMKNVPVLVSREESGEYKHTPLPTDGEVATIFL